MAARNSTSSTNTASRLKSKSSELSDFLRWRETAPSSVPNNALSDSLLPEVSRGSSPTKGKRRLPFLGLRKKTSGGVQGTASGIPTPRAPVPTPSAFSLHKQPSAASRLDGTPKSRRGSKQLEGYSGSSAVPRVSTDRSATPTPARPYGLSVSNPATTASTIVGASPAITVSVHSPEREVSRRPSVSGSTISTAASSLRAPTDFRSGSDVGFPSSALSDSAIGRSPSTASGRDRKSSFLERFKGSKSAAAKSATASSLPSGATNRPLKPSLSSSPPPSRLGIRNRTASHGSKTPSASSQELEAILHTKDLPAIPSSPTTPTSVQHNARSATPASTRSNRSSGIPPPGRVHSTSIPSIRSPSAASVRIADRTSDSPTLPSRTLQVATSKLPTSKSVTRATTTGKISPVRNISTTSPPNSPTHASWLLTKSQPKTSAGTSSSSGKDSPTTRNAGRKTPPPSSALRVPNTRARSASDSRVLEAASPAAADLPKGAGLGQSYHGLSSTTLPVLAGAPPSGPLPDPPEDDTPELVTGSPLTPSRILSSVASATSSLSSVSASTAKSTKTDATTISSVSSTSRLPTIPSGTPLLSKPIVVEAPKKSPQSASKRPSPTPPAQSFVPLPPTPANVYALQTENAALKQKIYELERDAHRHQREIRGLRWLVTNGSPTIHSLQGRPQAQGPASPPSAFSPKVPNNRRGGAFSDSEGPLSDDTTDVASSIMRHDTKAKISRGFESDTAALTSVASLTRKPAPPYSSASDASGPELSAYKRPSALQRARAARAEADKVLGRRSGSIDFSVAVDLAAEINSSESAEVEVEEKEAGCSSDSITPTSPVASVMPTAAEAVPSSEEKRLSKDERRASKALKRLSRSTAFIPTEEEAQAMYAQNLARGQAPSIEQVIAIDEAMNELQVIAGSSS